MDKVTLEIELHEYKYIAATARRHKDTIRKIGINELLKNDLIKDINIITSILEKSEVKPCVKLKKEAQDADSKISNGNSGLGSQECCVVDRHS